MARLPRLVMPGLAHYVLLRGHSGARVVLDGADEAAFYEALRHALSAGDIALHTVAVRDTDVHLLVRPQTAQALGHAVQVLGRRYVSSFNLRHGRSGTLWDGRYRAAVVEPGELCLFALRRIERMARAERGGALGDVDSPPGQRQALLTAPPELWALGNTPFEREAAYRALLAADLSPAWLAALEAALRSGRVFGTADFVRPLAGDLQRPLLPARPGRPARRVPRSPG